MSEVAGESGVAGEQSLLTLSPDLARFWGRFFFLSFLAGLQDDYEQLLA